MVWVGRVRGGMGTAPLRPPTTKEKSERKASEARLGLQTLAKWNRLSMASVKATVARRPMKSACGGRRVGGGGSPWNLPVAAGGSGEAVAHEIGLWRPEGRGRR